MKKLAIGMMSGTSLDGIDILIAEIEGTFTQTKVNPIAFKTYPFEPLLLEKIKKGFSIDESSSELLCSLNFELGEVFASAAKSLCEEENIQMDDISFIASHGQTIFHIGTPYKDLVRSSLQLGEGAVISSLCQTTVVSNFRAADLAVGGQGAPLVPYADFILFQSEEVSRSIHNIGGIANMTVLPKGCQADDVFAFDSGPGNMMIDYAMKRLYHQTYDKDGEKARSGHLINELMSELLSHPYLSLLPPKSTGRETFGDQFTEKLLQKYKKYSREDIIHTFTMFTVQSIVDSYKNFILPKVVLDEIIFCGGGSYNTYLLECISRELPQIQIKKLEDLGMNSSSKEALAFIILGNETLHLNPSNLKQATGAKKNVILGQVNYYFKGNI
ncbi:MAG: anhydro-N-acetylmuramic acid kinase AnmK [Acholeplasmataceae bacterium]|nr:anhydro-N-acetylmuramic acid kinase AnmK [Acholeplasmataceae bacterium]